MANNRMYLINERTKQRVLIAKYYPSSGWYVFYDDLASRLNAAFDGADFGHLSPEQREEPRLISSGGAFGEKWVLEYEVDEIN